MKTILALIIILTLSIPLHALDLSTLSDEELSFIYELNQKLIATQQQLDAELHGRLAGIEQHNADIGQANSQIQTLRALISERDAIISSQQATITQLSAVIENRHRFGDLGMYLNIGAGTAITGQVEGRVWLTDDLFLWIGGGVGYPYLWDRDEFVLSGNAGIGYSLEE